MAHSVELLLDARGDAAIRSLWSALDEAGLPSQAHVTSPTNRPHITLLAARCIGPEVDDALRGLSPRFPLGCVVGAPLVFGGPRQTLARLIVPSAELLDLHEAVYRRCLPHLTGDPYGHSRPGHWTPHATLGRRFGEAEIGPALAVVNRMAAGGARDIEARVTGLRRWDPDARVDHLLVG